MPNVQEMVKVSVILPVYNVERVLARCLDSVLGQSLKEIEVIAIDDGSPDLCGKILDDYAKRDSRIHVLHKVNSGVSAARNDGLKYASGEYVFFCDPDDWIEHEGLEMMHKEALRYGADVVCSDFFEDEGCRSRECRLFPRSFATGDKNTIAKMQCAITSGQSPLFSSPEFSHVCTFGGASWHHLIKRELVVDNNLRFDSHFDGMLEDGIFILHVFEHALVIAYLHVPTYHYCISYSSATHGYVPNFEGRFNRAVEGLSTFCDQFNKGELFKQAIFMRQIYFIGKACEMFYLHPNNEMNPRDRYRDFKRFVKSDSYRTAIRKVDSKLFGRKQTRIKVLLLKQKLFFIFWTVKRTLS